MRFPEALILVLYFGTLVALSGYGLHRLWVLALYGRFRHRAPARIDFASRPAEELPRVTLQLPLYNERYVAERLIDAAALLDYPRDRFEIQVLDDSTDDTTDRVARA